MPHFKGSSKGEHSAIHSIAYLFLFSIRLKCLTGKRAFISSQRWHSTFSQCSLGNASSPFDIQSSCSSSYCWIASQFYFWIWHCTHVSVVGAWLWHSSRQWLEWKTILLLLLLVINLLRSKLLPLWSTHIIRSAPLVRPFNADLRYSNNSKFTATAGSHPCVGDSDLGRL